MAGNVCAQALHQQARYFYLSVAADQRPAEEDWLEQLERLCAKTDLALHAYYLDHANALDVLARQAEHNCQVPPVYIHF